MDLTHEYTHDIGHRFRHLIWIITAIFLIIMGRLYYLQIIKGSYYHFFSEQNSIKEIKIPALRGTIYDRTKTALVDNRPAFDIVIIPQYIRDRQKVISSLAEILGMDAERIDALLQKAREMPSYYPVTVREDADENDMAMVRAYKTPWYDENDRFDLRGVDIQMRYARTYPDGLASSHLLGYLREVDPDRLKAYQEKGIRGYTMGDFVGIGGVEEIWDTSLRGRDGYDQRVVNAIGREVIWPDMELGHEEPINGGSLYLTIDARLQETAKSELEGKSGAVAAIDPANGEVLALYSSPPIDLNRLSSSAGGEYWREISTSPDKPLYNRAIQGAYPPGSTYKVVTAAAALGEKAVSPSDHLSCGGGLNYGGRLYQCWRKNGHGSINIRTALTSSCDTFFYQMGLKLGVDKIAKYANLLGLGNITNIDLPRERSGLIPTSKWKLETKGTAWQAGENLSIAVGQGYDTVTPLQNALMIATIANGGRRVTPHIARLLIDSGGHEVYRWREETPLQVISPEDIKVLKEGLQNVVDTPEGTAHRLKSLGLKIAGKTGTAQVISREQWRAGVEKLKDHAWFVGYAPYDNPKIAVAAIVEHGGFGASAAAPIVGRIIQKYLEENEQTH